jgi:hypothetical protein
MLTGGQSLPNLTPWLSLPLAHNSEGLIPPVWHKSSASLSSWDLHDDASPFQSVDRQTSPGGKDILPPPLPASAWIFATERMGQINLAVAFDQILIMQHFHFQQMIFQQGYDGTWKRRSPVLSPFPERTVICFME